MKKIIFYLRPYFPFMIVALLIKSIGTVMDLVIPSILAYMIDTIVPSKNQNMILLWGVVMIACAIIALAGNVIANRMAAKTAKNTTEKVRSDLFSKIMYLSVKQTDEFTIPSLVSRLSSDTYNLHNMIGMMQRLGVRAPILLVGGIVITIIIEPVLALVLIAILPMISLVVYVISKKGIPLYSNLQRSVDSMVRTVRDNFMGIRIIKALSKTEFEKDHFQTVNETIVKNEKKAGITMAVTNPAMNLFLNIGMTIVIVVGAYRVNSGISHPGKIIAFMTYFSIILNAMMMVTRMFVMYSKGVASADRIAEVLDINEDLCVLEKPNIETDQHIIFDNVSFSYTEEKKTLENISFSLKKGETLGIIGETGCGKTTILQLLLRFYDVDSGSIYLNGKDIRCMTLVELHNKFGIVFQNDFLYSDSISENIDFGRSLNRKAIENAASFAQATQFISELDDTFDHKLSAAGSNFSGGQKAKTTAVPCTCRKARNSDFRRFIQRTRL